MQRIQQLANQLLDGEITHKQFRSSLVVQLSMLESNADTEKLALLLVTQRN